MYKTVYMLDVNSQSELNEWHQAGYDFVENLTTIKSDKLYGDFRTHYIYHVLLKKREENGTN